MQFPHSFLTDMPKHKHRIICFVRDQSVRYASVSSNHAPSTYKRCILYPTRYTADDGWRLG